MIFNLSVALTKDEQDLYNEIDKQFHICEEVLGGKMRAFDTSSRFLRLKGVNTTGSNARIFIPENRVIYANEANDVTIPVSMCRNLTPAEVIQLRDKIHVGAQYWEYMRRRKTLCYNAHNKIALVKEIALRYPERKAIIFSALTAYADKIADTIGRDKCGTFHSKMNKEKYDILTQFSSNALQYISSAKALNAGLDIPECSLGISTSADSKKLAHVQRNGRISRFIDGKVSYFVNLYARNTQELIWIRKGTIAMEPKWIEDINELPNN